MKKTIAMLVCWGLWTALGGVFVAGEAATQTTQTNATTNAITIPAGTSLLVRMIDSLDSSKNEIGDSIHGSLESALVVGDSVAAPKGADVYGKLTNAKSARVAAGIQAGAGCDGAACIEVAEFGANAVAYQSQILNGRQRRVEKSSVRSIPKQMFLIGTFFEEFTKKGLQG
jgi:hypothetical protein